MTKYACGHECHTVITDSNPLTIAAYLMWKDEEGFDGDKSMCWECWCKRHWLQMGADAI